MIETAERLDHMPDQRGQDEAHPPAASVWPIVAAVGAALALPGLVHGVPQAAKLSFVLAGVAITTVALLALWLEDQMAPLRAARWRLSATPAGPPRVYDPPTTAARSESRAALHARAVQDIARRRFGFPTPDHPYYRTHLNHPDRAMGVQMPNGSVAYPDIVVVQAPENYAKIVAQVETTETINEEVAFYEWGPYADLAPLYLYVPVGTADRALALCRRLEIPVVGVRTWRHNVGSEEIEVNDYYTV